MSAHTEFSTAIQKYNPSIAYFTLNALLRPIYAARYDLEIRANTVPERGSLIIANHQHFDDIPLSGLAWQHVRGRIPRYVMRNNLPLAYLKLGGIPVWRPHEIRQELKRLRDASIDAEDFKTYIREHSVCFAQYVSNCLSEGQDVVLFLLLVQEIVKSYTRKVFLPSVRPMKIRIKRKAAVVPVTIRYGQKKHIRREVSISIGENNYCSKDEEIQRALGSLQDSD